MEVQRFPIRYCKETLDWPCVDVVIQNPLNHKRASTTGMIDTGADVSAVPVKISDELGLQRMNRGLVSQQDGVVRSVEYCVVIIEINGRFYPVHAPVLGKRTMIGRDILAHWHMTLDGPQNSGYYERA